MHETQSPGDRRFETEIGLVRQRLEVGIFACECLDDAPAVVGRTVVDHDHLIGGPCLTADVAKRSGQVSGVIEVAQDDGDGAHEPIGRRHRIPGDADPRLACPVGTAYLGRETMRGPVRSTDARGCAARDAHAHARSALRRTDSNP